MNDTATQSETSSQPAEELWDLPAVCSFFGGRKPLHAATLYRGIHDEIFPKPIKITKRMSRWYPSECRAALERMSAERDKPKPEPKASKSEPKPIRGRPRRKRID